MLFGAGILLFTGRSSENIQGNSVTDLFFRRLLWLLLFGVIHCYLLLWDGEILFCYALVGMFAFSFRHLLPKQLIIAAAVLLFIAFSLNAKDYFKSKDTYEKYTSAMLKKSKGDSLTKDETKSIDAWTEKVKEEKATPEQLREEMDARSKGYWS